MLSASADAGDRDAASRLAGLLAERQDLDGLRARAEAGDGDARRFAALLKFGAGCGPSASWGRCRSVADVAAGLAGVAAG